MPELLALRFRHFWREENGAVILIFILLLVPLLLIIGAGIDYSRSLLIKRQLTSAIDAAALAMAASPNLRNEDDLRARAVAYIRANYPALVNEDLANLAVSTAEYEYDIREISVSMSIEVPTSLMKMAGFDYLSISASSKVLRRENELEVVMVLDNSGSMGSRNKLKDMQDAAKSLVDILMGPEETSDKVKIGLVPFTASVNIDVPDHTEWLDRSNPADLNYQYLDLAEGESAFDVLDVMDGGAQENWGRCVRSRADPFDIDDTPPDMLAVGTLFSAYFLPFKNQGSQKSKKNQYANIASNQQNKNCPESAIQPLINQKSAIYAAIDDMKANGNTNIAEGLAWGWRVLSPDPPFTEGLPYQDNKAIKVIILLTDGENAVAGSNTFSSYGYGGSGNPQIGPYPNWTLDRKTEQICANIKQDKDTDTSDNDILIYTITFDISGSILSLMRNCATDPERFFDSPSAAELGVAFRKIAAGLNHLRLVE